MAKSELEVIQLLMKLIGHKTGEISKVTYTPQKIVFPTDTEGETSLPRCTPEEQGVSSVFIEKLFRTLHENNSCHMHKAMAVRNGYVIGECAFRPFDMDKWHVTHSMCKSVTGMAIGLLVCEGKIKLEDKIEDIFKGMKGPLQSLFSSGITVRHLLTMTSGSSFNESGSIASNDWRKQFLEAQVKFTPGSSFEYNSMNSYMLSAIVSEVTGESMFDYLKPRLFEPLGIKRVFWETCPQGINKGGWGMYLRMEDMAKLGQLYLNNGSYDGKQILPEEWVKAATTMQIPTGVTSAPGYGFQLWNSSSRLGAYTFNGMLGQNVYVFPDINMMIVTNAGNEDLFQKGNMSRTVHNLMAELEVEDASIEISDEVIAAQRSLAKFIKSVQDEPEASFCIPSGGWNKKKKRSTLGMSHKFRYLLMKSLDGVVYDMDDKGVGFMPLLMQIMHNNFTDGISSVGFKLNNANGAFYLLIKEGEKIHEIKCGLDGKAALTDIDEHGEIYSVATISEFSTDEYGRPVIRNEFYFTEDSTARVMNIYLGKRQPLEHDNAISFLFEKAPANIGIRFDEIPGSGMLINILNQFGNLEDLKGINGFVKNKLTDYGALDALILAIQDTVRPKLHGTIHDKDADVGYDVEYKNDSDIENVEDSVSDEDVIMEDG
ncbi:serine hydrolase domain-containing protein [Butyrivibrio sp. LC3010]|uniref:serine hydrolase domain-containing protein n=1 Tax=Butyrivibrio sp. LC3010 TaxID=1280680 RepID=UPI0003FD1E1B|nr:serine hydrolase [Butyrivibrio sp. LC3010]